MENQIVSSSLWAVHGEEVIGFMYDVKDLEAGGIWKCLQKTQRGLSIPRKVMSLAMVAAVQGRSVCGRVKPTSLPSNLCWIS